MSRRSNLGTSSRSGRRKTRRTTRRKRRVQGGWSWRDLYNKGKSIAKKGHDYAKANKLASRGLSELGFNPRIIRRRRVRRRVRRVAGAGFWGNLLKGAKQVGSIGTAIAGAIPLPQTQAVAGVGRALGLGRRKRRAGSRRVAGGFLGPFSYAKQEKRLARSFGGGSMRTNWALGVSPGVLANPTIRI